MSGDARCRMFERQGSEKEEGRRYVSRSTQALKSSHDDEEDYAGDDDNVDDGVHDDDEYDDDDDDGGCVSGGFDGDFIIKTQLLSFNIFTQQKQFIECLSTRDLTPDPK
ncbi:hypothetical protein BsWGS_25129 [Bradybaena similaris]